MPFRKTIENFSEHFFNFSQFDFPLDYSYNMYWDGSIICFRYHLEIENIDQKDSKSTY